MRIEDLQACDVWHNDIYAYHDPDKEISTIRDADETVVYQLEPLEKIRKIEAEIQEKARAAFDENALGLRKEMNHQKRLKLDYEEMTRLKGNDLWFEKLREFIHPRLSNPSISDIKEKFSTKERVDFLNKLNQFIDLCWKEVEENETAGQKRGRGAGRESSTSIPATSDFSPIRGIEERSDAQNLFTAKSLHDLAVLDFIAKQLRREILDAEREKKAKYPDGVVVEVRLRKHSAGYYNKDGRLGASFIMRIPSSMTVYQFREQLARKMVRAIRTTDTQPIVENPPTALSQNPVTNGATESGFGSVSLLCLRQTAFTYHERIDGQKLQSRANELGSVDQFDANSDEEPTSISLASYKDAEEQECVAVAVGDRAAINLEWSSDFADQYFDKIEYGAVDDLDALEGSTKQKGQKTISVIECIDKFCQKEQLEESEMWYCSQCKQHVRAWKQFHIYKSPPILLIHLKRFHYSARSHRRDKIGTFIDFPLKDLDLSDQVISWNEGCKPIYDCYAVSNHYGGLGGGHYTAHCLNNDGSWCYYDDSRITTNVDPKEVISDAAYVLYYRRKDVVVGEEFAMQMPTPAISGPALIQAERGLDNSSKGSSNVAMVGDDMDIDQDDAGSCLTAPMGSVSDQNDPLGMDDGLYSDDITVEGEQEPDSMPLQ